VAVSAQQSAPQHQLVRPSAIVPSGCHLEHCNTGVDGADRPPLRYAITQIALLPSDGASTSASQQRRATKSQPLHCAPLKGRRRGCAASERGASSHPKQANGDDDERNEHLHDGQRTPRTTPPGM
jgi:hypothetical protein